jgi:hypothetical protein
MTSEDIFPGLAQTDPAPVQVWNHPVEFVNIRSGSNVKSIYISLHELGKVDIPNFKRHWESEQFNPSFINLPWHELCAGEGE